MPQDAVDRLRAKIEQLVSRYETLERENAALRARIETGEAELRTKQEKITKLEKQIGDLRLKEAFAGASGDTAQAKRKVAGLIKDIDDCLAMLGQQ